MTEEQVKALFNLCEAEIDTQVRSFGLPLELERNYEFQTSWTCLDKDGFSPTKRLSVVDLAVTGSDCRFEIDIRHRPEWTRKDDSFTTFATALSEKVRLDFFLQDFRARSADCFSTDAYLARALARMLAEGLEGLAGAKIDPARMPDILRKMIGDSASK